MRKHCIALDEEIPHGIAVTIEKMRERKGQHIVDIEATIICERDSHKGIIIGKQGSMLKKKSEVMPGLKSKKCSKKE